MPGAMHIDFSTLTPYQRYKLMASLIVPRPIALVTTLGANGVVNAAPFSMFNMVGEDPPLVMLSVNHHNGQGRLKDTAANILRQREFVVHLCDEAVAEAMESLRETELDRALGVWRKKFGHPATEPNERAKQIRFLLTRGFNAEVVRKIVQGVDEGI